MNAATYSLASNTVRDIMQIVKGIERMSDAKEIDRAVATFTRTLKAAAAKLKQIDVPPEPKLRKLPRAINIRKQNSDWSNYQ